MILALLDEQVSTQMEAGEKKKNRKWEENLGSLAFKSAATSKERQDEESKQASN